MKHQRINIPKIDISGVDRNDFPKTLLEEFYHALIVTDLDTLLITELKKI